MFEYIRDRFTKDGIPFRLRPAQPSDTGVVIANIQAICAERIYLFTETFVLTNAWQRALANPLDEDTGHLLIVAQVGQGVVGHLRVFPAWYGPYGQQVGEIGLAIAKPWRERGIGTEMMLYALEWAKLARFQKIIASVIATNQRALNLFAKFDFLPEGRRTQRFHIAGKYVDEILLGRSVNRTDLCHQVS